MTYSVWFDGWREWRSGNRDAGLLGMRDGRARLAEAGLIYSVSLYETILAEAEAEASETDAAVATIDRAIAQSERTGQRLERGRKPSRSRRNLPQAKCLQFRTRRRGLPCRHRHRSIPESPRLRTARRVVAGEALPFDRPPRRRPRRPRAGARRVFAELSKCRRSPKRRRCWRRCRKSTRSERNSRSGAD